MESGYFVHTVPPVHPWSGVPLMKLFTKAPKYLSAFIVGPDIHDHVIMLMIDLQRSDLDQARCHLFFFNGSASGEGRVPQQKL